MTPEEHKVCELEKEVAVLKKGAADAATALTLAREMSATRWASAMALIVSLITLAISLFKR